MSKKTAYIMVMTGAALWGTIGLFVQQLYALGFTPWETVGIRLSFSAILIVLFLLLYKPGLLIINIRHLPYFVGTGVISIAFFNYFFFTVISEANLSLAVVLLYTGPVFVTILSRIFFKEPFTGAKGLALILMLAGCALTVEFLPSGNVPDGWGIVLFGFLSGFFYALYSIFGKSISRHYHSLTITAYSMITGSIFLLTTSSLLVEPGRLLQTGVLINGGSMALFSTVLAYVFYTFGLTYVESSRASILSIIEPAVAIVIGVAVFQDNLNSWQFLGFILVILSVAVTVYRRSTPVERAAIKKVSSS
ncbi:EamA family transporter [Salisediminibacterium beveridgei]|uniref:Permease of the drug/metabolite transporter (DMT) superfamily n=1 Tax=Salisediminibacterium beveridgei TaxID=632773 RepID=A0A1D7QU27_9BACI|nr:EamA family transporter [Salisediminibacterium beveridgei]AOM82524.1 Permease of the drug/metabolite transporter (DMT) superfamily [Salisediminibacterium beveridgei]